MNTDKIITSKRWAEVWAEVDPHSEANQKLTLMQYAKLCNRVKASWEIPTRFSSNARYEVYIESLISSGIEVPDEIIREIDPEANRYHDVPWVGARIVSLSNTSVGS